MLRLASERSRKLCTKQIFPRGFEDNMQDNFTTSMDNMVKHLCFSFVFGKRMQ